MATKLGKLERVKLEAGWQSEPYDFTPWLAREESLAELGDAIGMELELVSQEHAVGSFRADILCKNTADDSWVVIENQLDKTDHSHLGQILTYAAGVQALTVVWIAARFTDEHRAALDWLNRSTVENIGFFGVEVELWRVDDSLPAPNFNVVSRPNEWSRTAAHDTLGTSETKQMQYRYWAALIDFLKSQRSQLHPQAPKPRHWQNFAVGCAGVHIAAIQNTAKKRIGVELCMTDKETAKAYFHALERDKTAIESDIGTALEWREMQNKVASKILLFKDADPANDADWPAQHRWFKETIEKFDRAFRQRLKEIDPDEWMEGDAEAA